MASFAVKLLPLQQSLKQTATLAFVRVSAFLQILCFRVNTFISYNTQYVWRQTKIHQIIRDN